MIDEKTTHIIEISARLLNRMVDTFKHMTRNEILNHLEMWGMEAYCAWNTQWRQSADYGTPLVTYSDFMDTFAEEKFNKFKSNLESCKAVVVTFTIDARVIVGKYQTEEEMEAEAARCAIDHVRTYASQYISNYNITGIADDTEHPFGSDPTDIRKAQATLDSATQQASQAADVGTAQ